MSQNFGTFFTHLLIFWGEGDIQYMAIYSEMSITL